MATDPTIAKEQDAHAAHKEREHFFGAAKLVAVLTLLSRVLGMFRDMSLVWLGANWLTDCFWFAFALPNLFRRLFGEGALSAAFVPVFTETAERDGQEKAQQLLVNAMGLLAVFLQGLLVLIQIGLMVWLWLSPGREDRRYLVQLISIMLPFMVLVCLLALASSALNCRGHFAYPAAAPIILNVCMIAADGVAWWFWPGDQAAQLTTISASVTVAGVIQLAAVLWIMKAGGFAIMPRLRPMEPGVKRILTLMAPTLLGMGFLQISQLFDYLAAMFFATNQFTSTFTIFGHEFVRPLQAGILGRVTAATRIGQFPMGVFAISLGIAVFPLLSRYAHRGDWANLRDSVNRALRLALMESLATGTGLFVLAGPIIQLIYRHGGFTGTDANSSAYILRLYVLGMWAFCTHQILTRSFYSLKDPKTPMKVACVVAAVYMVLLVTLIWVLPQERRAGAFGLTPAITFSLNVVVLTWILRGRLGWIGAKKLVVSAGRSLVAAAAMALALNWIMAEMTGQAQCLIPIAPDWMMPQWYTIQPHMNGLFGWHSEKPWHIVAVCVPVGAAVFVAVAKLLRAPELGEMFQAMRNRKKA